VVVQVGRFRVGRDGALEALYGFIEIQIVEMIVGVGGKLGRRRSLRRGRSRERGQRRDEGTLNPMLTLRVGVDLGSPVRFWALLYAYHRCGVSIFSVLGMGDDGCAAPCPVFALLLRGPSGFEVEHAFFEGADSGVGGGVGGLEAAHAGEVAAREGLDASENLGLHVAGAFDGALFGGFDGDGQALHRGGEGLEPLGGVLSEFGDGGGERVYSLVCGHAVLAPLFYAKGLQIA